MRRRQTDALFGLALLFVAVTWLLTYTTLNPTGAGGGGDRGELRLPAGRLADVDELHLDTRPRAWQDVLVVGEHRRRKSLGTEKVEGEVRERDAAAAVQQPSRERVEIRPPVFGEGDDLSIELNVGREATPELG
jgi:hypothetical protein